MPRIVLRADSSATIGAGHLMRCLALGTALASRATVVLVTRSDYPDLEAHIRQRGLTLERIEEGADGAECVCGFIEEPGKDWAVIDGYQFDEPYLHRVRASGARVAVIDDRPRLKHYPVDLLIDPNPGALRQPYSLPKSSRALFGPRFTLLRPEVASLRGTTHPVAARAERLLVTMGAADPADATSLVLRALAPTKARFDVTVVVGGANPRLESIEALARVLPRARVLHNPAGLERIMSNADLAIAAVGGTIWELACLGVPTLLLSVNGVQHPIADIAQQYGSHVWIGSLADTTPRAIGEAVLALADDHAGRVSLVRHARALIDGEGASRVAQSITSPAEGWRRRAADVGDAEAVWELMGSRETFLVFERQFSDRLAGTVVAERDDAVCGVLWRESSDARPSVAVAAALAGGEVDQILLNGIIASS